MSSKLYGKKKEFKEMTIPTLVQPPGYIKIPTRSFEEMEEIEELNENPMINDLINQFKDDISEPYCDIPLQLKVKAFFNVYSDGQDGPDLAKSYLQKLSQILVSAYTVIQSVYDDELIERFKMGNKQFKAFKKEIDEFCENVKYFYKALADLKYGNADDSLYRLGQRISVLQKRKEKIWKREEKLDTASGYRTGRISFSGIFSGMFSFFLKHWLFFFTIGLLLFNMNFTEVFTVLPGLWTNPLESEFWSNAMTVLIRLFGAICLTFVQSPWVATRVINFCLWMVTEVTIRVAILLGSTVISFLKIFESSAKNIGMAIRYMLIRPLVFVARYIASIVCLLVLRADTLGLQGIYIAWENIQYTVGDLVMSSKESMISFLGKIMSFLQKNSLAVVRWLINLVASSIYEDTVGKTLKTFSGIWGKPSAEMVVVEEETEDNFGLDIEEVDDEYDMGGLNVEDVDDEDVFGDLGRMIEEEISTVGERGGSLTVYKEKSKKMEDVVTALVMREKDVIMSQAKGIIDETYDEVRKEMMGTYEHQLLEKPINRKMLHELGKIESDDLWITWGDGLVMATLVDFTIWSWGKSASTSITPRYKRIFRQVRKWLPLIFLMISFLMTFLSIEEGSDTSMLQFFNFTG